MKNCKVSFSINTERLEEILGKLGEFLTNEEIKTITTVTENTEVTVTYPEFEYTADDFENEEEFKRYKELQYFAKLGLKVKKGND